MVDLQTAATDRSADAVKQSRKLSMRASILVWIALAAGAWGLVVLVARAIG